MIGSLTFSKFFNNKTTSHCSEFMMCVEGVSPELGSLAYIWWVFLCLYIGSQEKLFRSETTTTFWSAKDFFPRVEYSCRDFDCNLMPFCEALLAQANLLGIIYIDIILITEIIHTLSNIFWTKILSIICRIIIKSTKLMKSYWYEITITYIHATMKIHLH